jgi:transcriptional regulator with XRE-family HTH domain|nr:MAG TPA: Repressor protein CI [Caudoviricetes sp.]
MSTLADRLKEGMSLRGLRQADIVEKTGINKGALSSYISGRYQPKQNNIFLLAKALDVNEAWLMGANVPMERATMADIDEYKNKMIEFSNRWNIQYFEKKMLESFSRLSDSNKEKAISYTENLLSIQQMEEEQAHLIPRAAHERTDIEVTDEMRQYDDELMRNDDVWK